MPILFYIVPFRSLVAVACRRSGSSQQFNTATVDPLYMWTRKSSVSISKMTPEDFIRAFKLAIKDPEVRDEISNIVSVSLREDIDSLRTVLQEKEAKIESLEKKVSSLESQVEGLEQYSRRNNIRVSGIVERPNENLATTTLTILNNKLDLDPPIRETDIDRIHRTGKHSETSSAPRSVLIKFVSYRTKNMVMINRSKLKSTDRSIDRAYFVSDDLTSQRSKIMYDLRQLQRDKKIMDAWTRDGNVLIKDSHQNVKVGKTLVEIKGMMNHAFAVSDPATR